MEGMFNFNLVNQFLKLDMKMERLFTRYKSRDGALRIYYDNNYIGNSKCLDYAFYLA